MIKVDYYEEVCCESCNEVIGINFDCPACNTKEASTDARCDIRDIIEGHNDGIIKCGECNARFKVIKYDMFVWLYLERL